MPLWTPEGRARLRAALDAIDRVTERALVVAAVLFLLFLYLASIWAVYWPR